MQLESRRGTLAVVDQMLVSGTNFLALMALGRAAGPEALGQFSVGFSVLVIVTTALRSLVVAPYAVLGRPRTERHRCQMRGCVLAAWLANSLTFAVLISTVMAALWLLASSRFEIGGLSIGYSTFVLSLVVAIPAWSLRELARQMSLADLRFRRALIIDAIVVVSQLVAIAVLFATESLTALSLMLAITVPCGVIGIVWLMTIRKSIWLSRNALSKRWPMMWRFGRWGALSQASHATQSYTVNWILVFTGGYGATGIYAAAWSIIQLASPFVQGAGNALTPLLANRRATGGKVHLLSATRHFTRLAAIASAIYVVAVWIAGPQMIHWIYGDTYASAASLLLPLAASVALSAMTLVATKVISVLEFPQVNFRLNLLTLVLTVFFATLGGTLEGIYGACLGLLLAAFLGTAAKWASYVQVIQR